MPSVGHNGQLKQSRLTPSWRGSLDNSIFALPILNRRFQGCNVMLSNMQNLKWLLRKRIQQYEEPFNSISPLKWGFTLDHSNSKGKISKFVAWLNPLRIKNNLIQTEKSVFLLFFYNEYKSHVFPFFMCNTFLLLLLVIYLNMNGFVCVERWGFVWLYQRDGVL